LEEIRETFRLHGVRSTRQRELVFGELASTKSHPTAEELYESVRTLDGGISLATVYNTLETLQESGLCRRLPSEAGPARYDADMSEHVHMTTSNGTVLDLPEDLSQQLLAAIPECVLSELKARTGMSLRGLSLHVAPDPVQAP
ncbi:MAG: Fur family transcriptional regulator, partial [Phycisphaerales bacterium]